METLNYVFNLKTLIGGNGGGDLALGQEGLEAVTVVKGHCH